MASSEHPSASTSAGEAAWRDDNLDNPHAVADKAQRVQAMFSAIAKSYDLNNRLHSMWRDQAWRRKAVKLCAVKGDDVVVDVACGTGDLSLAFADAGPKRVLGIDFTHNMTVIAGHKRAARGASLATPVHFADGDAMQLPLPDATADVVSIAFGIRNVAEPAKAIGEFYRILRPGGRVCILEFSLPTNPLMLAMYNFYFRHIMPRTATLISGDRSGAYKYLPQSVNTFLGRQQMVDMLEGAGFTDVSQTAMTFGICIAYIGHKR
ncbi:MAG: bifunctional demethylmenaquinone methyltransferase/2-methoxy-6-polyprenyl-1,4-benzoquinol methylase UbiE [Phycisphaera sp.]|nr:bifunctional demethylmenaquinone methyltransferase/2-methoxy-6-polyprenyl-1,4-benzoquinol methylase UbiE [Phycisphaera sp.]